MDTRMNRPTRNVLFIVGALVVVAVVTLSLGPSVDVRPDDSPFEKQLISPTDMPTGEMPLPVLNFNLPEFQGITNWWNTPNNQPLTPESLRGKVVLVDFWTYSCINCIRTFPFLREMQAKYGDNGLVIVGVHTPEFAFEADPANVAREIEKNDLQYPVALDPDFKTWNTYHNRFWPAEYFFDHEGRLRRTHFGEGEYQESEEAIRSLLKEAGYTLDEDEMTEVETPDFSKIKTHETYFGLLRGREFMRRVGAQGEETEYPVADKPSSNRWDAEGTWVFQDEYVEAQSKDAKFLFNVQASKIHLVMESADGTPKEIEIFVDGERVNVLSVQDADLYDIADLTPGDRHVIEVIIRDAGVRFFAATFS